ncbi:MAG TPA: hypothetical protein VGJ13_04895 [Pseudonocardiaceae bacterium]|jgi:hypothetical protein
MGTDVGRTVYTEQEIAERIEREHAERRRRSSRWQAANNRRNCRDSEACRPDTSRPYFLDQIATEGSRGR